MKQAFTSALFAAAVAASAIDAVADVAVDVAADTEQYRQPVKGHVKGGKGAASPARPDVPHVTDAVKAFDTFGTLFGEHRYQLQVAQTGEMLVGTEALREAISGLQDRVKVTAKSAALSGAVIDENDSDIEDNRAQIKENRARLSVILDKIVDLESHYDILQHKLAIDREAIIMMCHQYAFSKDVPKECIPIIGSLKQPLRYNWQWPEQDYRGEPPLPPFKHPLPKYSKDTTDDEDDKIPLLSVHPHQSKQVY